MPEDNNRHPAPNPASPPGSVINSIWGAIILARFDLRGLAFLDLSHRGLWPSFMAALVVAPLHIFYLAAFYQQLTIDFNGPHAFVLELLGYVIAWTLFPLILWEASPWIGKRERVVPFIITYNWVAVVQNALLLPIGYFVLRGMLPADVGQGLWLIGFVYILILAGFIVTKVLGLQPLQAAGIVAFDLMTGLILNDLIDWMIFSPAAGAP